MKKYPSIYDIPPCNRGLNMKEDLERILRAQIMMCEWQGIDPDSEPYIIHLKVELERFRDEEL